MQWIILTRGHWCDKLLEVKLSKVAIILKLGKSFQSASRGSYVVEPPDGVRIKLQTLHTQVKMCSYELEKIQVGSRGTNQGSSRPRHEAGVSTP